MDQQWSSYSDNPSSNRQNRYAPQSMTSPQQPQRGDMNSAPVKYDAYSSPAAGSRAGSMAVSTPMAAQSRSMEYNGDGDGDLHMEDADPYNKQKYTQQRPSHQHRQSSQFLPAEESSAARRYSPMNITPASPYNAATPQQPPTSAYNPYNPQNSNRQSPTRSNSYAPPPQSYYSTPNQASRAHASQLPPLQSANLSPDNYYPPSATAQLNSVFGRDARSPRNPQQPHPMTPGQRGQVPQFAKVTNVQHLEPRINPQPPFRRANPDGGFISPLQALTTHLPATYRICNPNFKYESSRNPRRVLTKPSKGVKNDGYDNEDSDYILYVNDILGSEEAGHKNRYLILDVLGQGTFGQVVKCQNLRTQEVVAVKVVKNRTAYFNQSMMEVSVLDLLNTKLDKNDDHHLLRLKDTFIHRQHLCLVFELLSVNLYELIKQNQFRGLSTTLVRVFAQQLLNGLVILSKARLIHCDLKPENILLKNLESPIIKIIDFGSACDERQTVYTYIQSRFYRSPEVLLGLPYSAAIDMWSLGCIVVELFLGLPLFPGSSEYNQVARITEMLGLPPTWMLEMGKQSGEFFEKVQDEYGRKTYRLKSMEQYSREHGTKEQPSKKYFSATTLPEIIKNYPMPRKNMKPAEIEKEMQNREAFIDFVKGLLNINPLERWTPQQAKGHPFITQQKFMGAWTPLIPGRSAPSNRSPAPGVQQQQQAEAISKQRAQNAQAVAQAQNAAYMNQYAASPQSQTPNMYNNMYTPNHHQQPPPYPASNSSFGQMMQGGPAPIPQAAYAPQQNLYAQAATRAGRQRAQTMDQSGIPPALQRVVSHLDPSQPIRLQPSPAYYPPPPEGTLDSNTGSARRRGSRAGGQQRGNRDFIRTLEDRTLEEGFMSTPHWQ